MTERTKGITEIERVRCIRKIFGVRYPDIFGGRQTINLNSVRKVR